MVSTRSKRLAARVATALLLLLSLTLAFALAEWGARLSLSPYMGWQWEYPLAERIADFQGSRYAGRRVVVLGDSYVEYYRGTDANVIAQANRHARARGADTRYWNFGFSGASIHDYVGVLEYVSVRAQVDGAVIVIYTGNDYPYYWQQWRGKHTAAGSARERANLRLRPEHGYLRNLLKRSVLLNGLWRYGVKGALGWFTSPRDPRADAHAWARRIGLPEDGIDERLARLSPHWLEAAERDVINYALLPRALVDPEHLLRLRRGFGADAYPAERTLMADLDELASVCQMRAIACAVVLVDHPAHVDPSSHRFYAGIGFDVDERVLGEPALNERVQAQLGARGIPVLRTWARLSAVEGAYLRNDPHLSVRGHQLLGRWIDDLPTGAPTIHD